MRLIKLIFAVALAAGQAVRASPVTPREETKTEYNLRIRSPGTKFDNAFIGLSMEINNGPPVVVTRGFVASPEQKRFTMNVIGAPYKPGGAPMIAAAKLEPFPRQQFQLIYPLSSEEKDMHGACQSHWTCVANQWATDNAPDVNGTLSNLYYNGKPGHWGFFTGKLMWLETQSKMGRQTNDQIVQKVFIDLVPVRLAAQVPVPAPEDETQYHIRVRAPGQSVDKAKVSVNMKLDHAEPVVVKRGLVTTTEGNRFSMNIVNMAKFPGGERIPMIAAATPYPFNQQHLVVIYAANSGDVAGYCYRQYKCEANAWAVNRTHAEPDGRLPDLYYSAQPGKWIIEDGEFLLWQQEKASFPPEMKAEEIRDIQARETNGENAQVVAVDLVPAN